MKPPRRRFLSLAAGAAVFPVTPQIATAQQRAAPQTPLEPLVWPVVAKVPPEVRTFAGHTDTVPDIVGRFGTPASLVIFTEGNHLMVLHSEDILGAFPTWAKSQSMPQLRCPIEWTKQKKKAVYQAAFLDLSLIHI